jgi:hypothetical protein
MPSSPDSTNISLIKLQLPFFSIDMGSSAHNHIRRHENVEVKAGTHDGPSMWQQKYGTKSNNSRHDQFGEDNSIFDWIASIRESAEIDAEVSKVRLDYPIIPNNSPVDKVAADVILRMNQIFDGIPANNTINSNENLDIRAFEENHIFDGESLSKYLQTPNFQCDSLINTFVSIEKSNEDFSRDNMAILFRRTHDDEIARRCINCLQSHTKINRILRGRVFSQWKLVTMDTKDSKDLYVRRFHRRRRLRLLRCLISTWMQANQDRKNRLERAKQIHRSITKSDVLSSWRMYSQQTEESIDCVREAKLTKLKRSTLLQWLAVIGWSKQSHSQSEFGASVSIRNGLEHLPGRDISAVDDGLTSQSAKESCRTIDMHELESMQQPVNQHSTLTLMSDRKMPEQTKLLQGYDKENGNRHTKLQLRPVRHKPQNRVQTTSTPKMVLEMNQRKQERDKNREILRQRYEQKANEKEKCLKEELRKKDKEAMKIQREFVERKAAEERREKIAVSQWKQACCLAAMHHRMALQKRTLHQWNKIFQMNSFNKRKVRCRYFAKCFISVKPDVLKLAAILFDKAYIAWSDTTVEKCWHCWLLFKNTKQKDRNERMCMHQQLAGTSTSSYNGLLHFALMLVSPFNSPKMISISVDCLQRLLLHLSCSAITLVHVSPELLFMYRHYVNDLFLINGTTR